MPSPAKPGTDGVDYTERLRRLGGARWKQVLDVQAPYRWNLRRLKLGRTLDVGCGIGRNLANLGGNCVGVDHNPTSVQLCRDRGFEAYVTADFLASAAATSGGFDSLLASHLLEHMGADDALATVRSYLPAIRPGGTVVFITPQERGYASDPTHVRWVAFPESAQTCTDLGLTVGRQYSFPFPRPAGKLFTYNEFITVARKPA